MATLTGGWDIVEDDYNIGIGRSSWNSQATYLWPKGRSSWRTLIGIYLHKTNWWPTWRMITPTLQCTDYLDFWRKFKGWGRTYQCGGVPSHVSHEGLMHSSWIHLWRFPMFHMNYVKNYYFFDFFIIIIFLNFLLSFLSFKYILSDDNSLFLASCD